MSEAVVVEAGAPDLTSWWEWLKAKAKAIKTAVVEFLAPKPLKGRAFYVASRVVAATAGSLAAVVVWATLVVGAHFGIFTLMLAFSILVALLAVAACRITLEPDKATDFNV